MLANVYGFLKLTAINFNEKRNVATLKRWRHSVTRDLLAHTGSVAHTL